MKNRNERKQVDAQMLMTEAQTKLKFEKGIHPRKSGNTVEHFNAGCFSKLNSKIELKTHKSEELNRLNPPNDELSWVCFRLNCII